MSRSLPDEGPHGPPELVLLIAWYAVYLGVTSLVYHDIGRELRHEKEAGVWHRLGEVSVNEGEAAATRRGEGDLAVSAHVAAVATDHDRPLSAAQGALRSSWLG
jgi:hypothetical protein